MTEEDRKGGGQTYKTLYEVFDPSGNNNRGCYFFNENQLAVEKLKRQGHIPLWVWLEDPATGR